MPDKPEARTYSASMTPQTGFNPAAVGDKCFLCGNGIADDAPRRFWTGKSGNAMLLGHKGCLDRFEANDYTWPTEPAPAVPAASAPPKNIAFDSLAHMSEFLSSRGSIPASTRVTVAGQVIQDGDL